MSSIRSISHYIFNLFLFACIATTAVAQERYLLWGDTHQHSGLSFDVYLFGTVAATPDIAYNYAKGKPVISPVTGNRWQIQSPLDFMVLADHAELMGAFHRLYSGDKAVGKTKSGKAMLELGGAQTDSELLDVYKLVVSAATGSGANDYGLSAVDLTRDMHAGDARKPTWNAVIDAAERHNQPGQFTTFIGWEWSSLPKGANLHRVVFTPQGGDIARQFLPYSQMESTDPESLWSWLENTRRESGAEFIAIPHNSNISMGRMFPTVRENGEPIDADYARRRMQWEPVSEMTQIKGDAETHPQLSPNDDFADFETFPFILTPQGLTPEPTKGDYLRSALTRGLEIEKDIKANPFQVGMIGSSDSHTGMPAVEENNFSGKGKHDSIAVRRGEPTGIGASKGWDMAASGYVGVWAEENSRQSIYKAFRRREVYATSGPRIALRMFAGFDFSADDLKDTAMATKAYSEGVPMGGQLKARKDKVPGFLIQAAKDPLGGNLDRVQVIKAWVDDSGKGQEKIFDVALSDGRMTGDQLVGNTVDITSGRYSNTIGAEELSIFWQDPEYKPVQSAYYYVRVLQIPTPRYSLLDAIALGISWRETDKPATIQERAYSSPVWISP